MALEFVRASTGLLGLFFWLALEFLAVAEGRGAGGVTALEWSTLLSLLDMIQTQNHRTYHSTGNVVLFSVSKANICKKTMIYNSHSQNPLLHTPTCRRGMTGGFPSMLLWFYLGHELLEP